MKQIAVIAQFYKRKADAEKRVKEKNRIWRGDLFTYIKTPKGYFVLSKRQLTV